MLAIFTESSLLVSSGSIQHSSVARIGPMSKLKKINVIHQNLNHCQTQQEINEMNKPQKHLIFSSEYWLLVGLFLLFSKLNKKSFDVRASS